MGIRVVKRGFAINNTAIFVISSILFLFVCYALNKQSSVNDVELLKSFWDEYRYLCIWSVLSLISIWNFWRVGLWMMLALFTMIFAIVSNMFLQDMDKQILIFNFLFVLSSFWMVLIYFKEYKLSGYRPNFSKYDLNHELNYDVNVSLFDSSGREVSCKLTNCDNESIFVISDDTYKRVRGKVSIVINFLDKKFKANGVIVSTYEKGFGLRIDHKYNKECYNWADFREVISNRGYFN